MNRLLYLSVHEILEHDEIKLFNELGLEVFSPGAYVNPTNRGDSNLRPDINNLNYDPSIVDQWHQLCTKHPGEDGKLHLTKEFVNNFDCILVMHLPEYIIDNWEAIKHKTVIWRTIGQSLSHQERRLSTYRSKGMKIVRYSPFEQRIPEFCGADKTIRFYKDPDDFLPWTGDDHRVVCFTQSMKQRNQACNYNLFVEATEGLPRVLFGPGNEDSELNGGKLSYEEQRVQYSRSRCYFAAGTHPASYTLNFMEAWIAGVPLAAPGPKKGNATYFPGHDLYEVPSLIKHGRNGFISDDPRELKDIFRSLLGDARLAREISAQGRASAIAHFGKAKIKEEWLQFFKGLGFTGKKNL